MTSEIAPFQAISISRLAHALKAEGRSILHMEFGQPATGAPRAAIAAAHRVLDSDGMGYWESPALKARLARHYDETYGVGVEADQFILTCGASPALVLALASSFSPGDRVALARPGSVAYRNTLRALHMVPVEIPCGADTRFQLTAAALAAIDPAPAGVIIASPANPTGTIITADELAAIAEVCADRGIRVISDEIYHGITFGEAAASAAGLTLAPHAVVINSFSKYYAMTGWRLGWMVLPADLIRAVECLQQNLFISPPTLSQLAAEVVFDCTEELDARVAAYRNNRDILLSELPAAGFGRLAPSDGAFYLYADIAELTNDSRDFCRRMLAETGVAATPGVDFDPHEGLRTLRFSYAGSAADMVEAARRLTAWRR